MRAGGVIQPLLALFALSLLCGCIYGLFRFEPPAGSREALLLLIGAIGNMVGLVMGYYFGSSVGSRRKTELMARPDADSAP